MTCKNDLNPVAVHTVVLTALLLLAAPVAAQNLPPTSSSPQDIQRQVEAMGLGSQLRQQILGSGLSEAQIRQQLASRGYDPSILDPYLDEGVETRPNPDDDVMEALDAIDFEFRPDTTAASASRAARDSLLRRELVMPDSSSFEEEHGLRVFGLETFARGTSEFEAMAMGPVPPGYVLGPGDELTLILTGDVERVYSLPVTREGLVVIPQVGQVWVNGLTMSEFRDRLYTELGRAYSGIDRGPEASTHFEVTLGRVRSNQLFVTGEVVRPGSYMTSPVASVLNALYLAGGPRPNGSFRHVRVMRGGRTAAEVDLYAYLTHGDNVADIALQPGDVIFVPVHGPQVAVKGEVGRPAIYEVAEGETLLDLLQHAGGLTAPAAVGRARITRILPPGERMEPGLDRTVVEVDLAAVIRGDAPAPQLRDGDELRVFRVRSEVRRVVNVSGAVWKNCSIADVERPMPESDSVPAEPDQAEEPEELCTFRFEPGMRAWDAIEAAEGLQPEAYRTRAQIVRVDQTDSTLAVIPFSLETDGDGIPVENPLLQEFDHIRILSRADFRHDLNVQIAGEVEESTMTVPYRDGLTLGDLILEAGGLTPEADMVVEVSRRPDAAARAAGRVTETVRVPVDTSYMLSNERLRFFREGSEWSWNASESNPDLDTADEFLLRPYDRVFVRRLPNLEDQRMVQVEGEVQYPGTYALATKDERLSEMIARAGGLSSTAFTDGFRYYRNGELLNAELDRALAEPGSRHDLILLPGDSLVVPEYNPVVLVRGAVNSPTSVVYVPGADLGHYIASAGGYARHADTDRVYVQYANGQRAVRNKVLFFAHNPDPGPGSVVTVPLVPEEDRLRVMELASDIAQILGTLGTALLVLTRL